MTTAELFYGLFLPFILVTSILAWFVFPAGKEPPLYRLGTYTNIQVVDR